MGPFKLNFLDLTIVYFLVPLFVFAAIEMQFVTYTLIIHDRLVILNKILLHFSMINQSNKFYLKRSCKMQHTRSVNKGSHNNVNSTNPKIKLRCRAMTIIPIYTNSQGNINQIFLLSQLEKIYHILEKSSSIIDSSYGLQIVVILILKFTTLTTLLYFHFMILIRYR